MDDSAMDIFRFTLKTGCDGKLAMSIITASILASMFTP